VLVPRYTRALLVDRGERERAACRSHGYAPMPIAPALHARRLFPRHAITPRVRYPSRERFLIEEKYIERVNREMAASSGELSPRPTGVSLSETAAKRPTYRVMRQRR